VFEAIQSAFRALGRPPLPTITAPFRGVFRGIYTFPVLDTYRAVRREPLLGPIEAQPALTPLPQRRRIFIYSAADFARIDALTHCIMDLGAEASVYLRGNVGPRASILRSRGVEVFDAPPKLADILPQVSAVFSHAGPGFTNAALTGGRPHIIFPRHFEAHAAALGLVDLRCGIRLDDLKPETFRTAYEQASTDASMQAAAQKAGAEAQAFMRDARALETSLDAIRRLLA
jgi:UDP:flavonoid glycosyltransferase YjiC (YdhE family)